MTNSSAATGVLVSIVTPSLNRSDLLERTMRSVRNQTYRNVEHIVVDGGSNDGTVDLLKRYESTYALTWISEADEGMYAAINKGLSQAQGDVLAYLNSDDLYLHGPSMWSFNSFSATHRLTSCTGTRSASTITPEFAACTGSTPSIGTRCSGRASWRSQQFFGVGG